MILVLWALRLPVAPFLVLLSIPHRWQVLAEALRHNSTLRVLSLRQNHIGDVGVQAGCSVPVVLPMTHRDQALAEALSQNRTLTEIYLNWEHQSAVGVQAQRLDSKLSFWIQVEVGSINKESRTCA